MILTELNKVANKAQCHMLVASVLSAIRRASESALDWLRVSCQQSETIHWPVWSLTGHTQPVQSRFTGPSDRWQDTRNQSKAEALQIQRHLSTYSIKTVCLTISQANYSVEASRFVAEPFRAIKNILHQPQRLAKQNYFKSLDFAAVWFINRSI